MKQVGLIAVVMAAGCTVTDPNEVPETSEVVQHADDEEEEEGERCPLFRCTNSPELIHFGIHEVSLFGQLDRTGFFLDRAGRSRVQIWKNGYPWDLHIENNRLVGKSHVGSWRLEGAELKGAELRVRQNISAWFNKSRPAYKIAIDNVRLAWFEVGPQGTFEAYRMSWVEPDGRADKNICNGPPPATIDPKELLGMATDEVLVYSGDRIDPTTMTMSAVRDNNWFNFGCAGRTLAKLHLTRNTITSQVPTSDPMLDWARRQATLKLLVADYCGKGRPITMSGTPLRWKTELMGYIQTPSEIEARWDQNGASCLGKPRLGAWNDYFGDVAEAIRKSCDGTLPPPCQPGVDDFAGKLRISGIP
jgi:hypothetical protein